MIKPHEAYESLLRRSRERALLATCLELLSWDELTYMPRGAVEYRGQQMAYLAGLDHDKGTDPAVGEWLTIVAQSPLIAEASSPAAVNVRRWRRAFERLTRVPRSLIEELAEVTAFAQREWAEARLNDDFARFAPWLSRIVELKRQEISCHDASEHPYDVLLDEYEPGITTRQVAELFASLRAELSHLLSAIGASSRATSAAIVQREFAVDRQRIFAESIAADIGFDFRRGRMDATTHPFYSAAGPEDCRITTRYSVQDFGDAFFSMMHEMGHGLYEQGLDPTHYGTPFGEAPSTGLHESQSQFWEKFIGRERAFWRHVFPRARDVFHDALHDVQVEDFYQAVNHVEPTWNRVRADPVTYDLHVMIRFELEQSLMTGSLAVDDIPAAWNDAYASLLGVLPANDTEGCLQDGHWAAGMFGYFPIYTLGNAYAAQFYATARAAIDKLDAQLARGEFVPLLEWLKDHVFARGGADDAASLIEQVTRRPPSHQPLVRALWERYREIYAL
jgi:carboxypeptidase Taq